MCLFVWRHLGRAQRVRRVTRLGDGSPPAWRVEFLFVPKSVGHASLRRKRAEGSDQSGGDDDGPAC